MSVFQYLVLIPDAIEMSTYVSTSRRGSPRRLSREARPIDITVGAVVTIRDATNGTEEREWQSFVDRR